MGCDMDSIVLTTRTTMLEIACRGCGRSWTGDFRGRAFTDLLSFVQHHVGRGSDDEEEE